MSATQSQSPAGRGSLVRAGLRARCRLLTPGPGCTALRLGLVTVAAPSGCSARSRTLTLGCPPVNVLIPPGPSPGVALRETLPQYPPRAGLPSQPTPTPTPLASSDLYRYLSLSLQLPPLPLSSRSQLSSPLLNLTNCQLISVTMYFNVCVLLCSGGCEGLWCCSPWNRANKVAIGPPRVGEVQVPAQALCRPRQ